MLIHNDNLGSPELFYNTAMNTLPTVQRSAYDSLYAGVATPFAVTNQLLNSEYAKKPRGRAMFDKLEAINLERQTPGMGWGQWLADEGANMLGYSLNPATWALGAAGGAVARTGGAAAARGLSAVLPDAATIFMRKPLNELLAQPIAKFLPAKVGKEGAEKTLSSGLLTDKTISTFGTFAGAGVPQGVYDNFNRKTGNINWGGVARESAEMGAFGVAIGTIPFAWGVLRGKVNRSMGRSASDVVDNRSLDTALERGHITPKEHQWYSDYLAHQKEPHNEEMTRSLQQRGSHIVNENGHKANTATNEATFDFLTGDDVNNLQGVVADQLASAHLPETQRMALSNYIVHNRMDFFRKDPKSLDGLRGYVDFVNKKLEDKPLQIAEADRILDEHLLKGLNEEMPFSQKELLENLRNGELDVSELNHLPIVIPKKIQEILKKDKKDFINYLREVSENYEFKRLSTDSDVVNHEFYHGTGNLENIQDFDISRANIDSLYGYGLYITDNKKIASGYAEAKQQYKLRDLKGTGKILGLKFKQNPKLIDLEQTPKKEIFDIIKSEALESTQIKLTKSMSKKTIDEIFKNIKNQMKVQKLEPDKYGLPPAHYLDRYNDFLNNLNDRLLEHGYDGYLHTGGNRMGSKVNHNVVVLFGADYTKNGKLYSKSPASLLNQKMVDLAHDYKEKIESYANKLQESENLPNPKEELLQLKEALLSNGLKQNFERSPEYHRLVDLSSVWHNAQTLLDRIHLEHEYNRQESFKKVSDTVLRNSESEMPTFARPENVVDYLKARIEQGISKIEPIENLNRAVEAKESIPGDYESVLGEQEAQTQKINAEAAKNELIGATDKFKEFKKSDNVFKNLISCVMGGISG